MSSSYFPEFIASLDQELSKVRMDMMAMGALRALREVNLIAGHDVSVIGHDDLPVNAYADSPFRRSATWGPSSGGDPGE